MQTERAKPEALRAQPGSAQPPGQRQPESKPDAQPTRAYLKGARVLSVGIAATGLLTFAYFSIASHVLGEASAKRIDVLWSVMFVIISVIYRPVEQLLSRTIAERRARGQHRQAVGVPLAIQGSFAAVFLVLALAFREQLVAHVFAGSQALYWILVVGTVAYAASYFARGWLAGHERFGLFGGLVLTESFSRLCFVLAVAVGLAAGETAVALGIAAAPLLSLIVVPAAFARARHSAHSAHAPDPADRGGAELRAERQLADSDLNAGDSRAGDSELSATDPQPAESELSRADPQQADLELTADEADAALAGPATESVQEAAAHPTPLSVRRGSGFAIAVSAIMLSEQTLLNAAVLTVAATASATALAGIVFNVMLIARAPLQLFQAIQTTLLPHLTGLEVSSGRAAFARAVRLTVRWIAIFAGVVALALLAIGPAVMEHALFGQHFAYGRIGLALIGLGMGMHLVSGTLNQAALARGRARAAAACWLLAAAVFLAWMLLPVIDEQLLRTELGYLGATALLALLLAILYRRGGRESASGQMAPPQP